MILQGKPVADAVLERTRAYIQQNNLKLKLAIITSGTDPASAIYARNKMNACASCGIDHELISMPESSTTKDYAKMIAHLNNDPKTTGIILQLPLPSFINEKQLIELIAPEKDVDGFTKKAKFPPCTPAGILTILDYYKGKNWLEGKNAVVIGRSSIVGSPMATLLTSRNATVTLCHSKTPDMTYYTKNADVIVVATGKAKLLKKEMVKEGSTIIDVGINRIDGKLYGDADFENLQDICDITPVPGGVGPMTVATLVARIVMLDKEVKKQKSQEKTM
ncbi:MAG: bifunctional 5,10-methylenetetrahydrofolate dehydrogenase/5,10-methenyltetrahydrofolate cyclohydrolase [Clostridia bacterium]|nr:bifunctional 5,10-methylenetetrahydrofolate dehydrogenase/5,10-methenyltetrahydrofolate cyclohydrolase [Clostridia bacterium]